MRTERPADYPGCPATTAAAVAAGRPLSPTSWGWLDVTISLVGAWVLSIAFTVLVAFLLLADIEVGFALLVLGGSLASWVAQAGWPLFATRVWGNGPKLDLGLKFQSADLLWGIAGGVAAYLLGWAAALATEWVAGSFDSAAGSAAEEIARDGQSWQLVLFAAVVLLGAPLAEEIGYRGMLFAAVVRSGVAGWGSILITAALFALLHFEPVRLGVLFAVGLVFGWLRHRTGRLGAPIIAHAVNNLPGALGILALTP